MRAAQTAQGNRTGRARDGSAKGKEFRAGSKSAAVIALLSRPQGATIEDLIDATKWQAHSVRGFLSGTVRKKLRLKVRSAKRDGGERFYKIGAR